MEIGILFISCTSRDYYDESALIKVYRQIVFFKIRHLLKRFTLFLPILGKGPWGKCKPKNNIHFFLNFKSQQMKKTLKEILVLSKEGRGFTLLYYPSVHKKMI